MIWLLLVLYQIKHFVCDYPLQGKYMLGKFKGGTDWILPLAAHASVHGGATFLIGLCVKPKSAFWLALFDLVVHFCMDRIKASPNMLGRYKALSSNEMKNILSYEKTTGLAQFSDQLKSNVYFWWALGLDQGVHHLTHYAIIWRLLS
jgi:Protein of unknown function (DUF3307)